VVLYTISFILMLLSCIVAGYQKRGWKWSTRLPSYIAVSAVLTAYHAATDVLPWVSVRHCCGDRK